MELIGDVDHVECHFGPFGDSVSVDAIQVHGLRQMYHRLINHFGHTRWYSMVRRLNWKLDLVHLWIVLTLMQDRCTAWAKRTLASETILDAAYETPR
jgi:hypothetical protein